MGEGLFDDDESESGLPPPAPDRLWRHPAEVGAELAAANMAAREAQGRRWPSMLVSFIAGAAAVGLVWLFSDSPEPTIEVIEIAEIAPAGMAEVDEPVGFDDWAVQISQPNVGAVVGLHLGGSPARPITQGFLYRTDGHIIASAHAVAGATDITATLSDGSAQPARILAADPVSGVAVLKVTSPELTPIAFSSDSVAHQDRLVGIAAHTEQDRAEVRTVDLVGTEQAAEVPNGDWLSGLYRLDGELDDLWAGAPIVDENGGVVAMAINTVHGTNYAIPAARARRVADDLIEFGHTQHQAWLGIQVSAGLTEELKAERGLHGGVLISRAWQGAPASAAGLRAGDVIVRYGDVRIEENIDLFTVLRAAEPGDVVDVQYSRLTAPDVPRIEVSEADEYSARIMTATVTLGVQPTR